MTHEEIRTANKETLEARKEVIEDRMFLLEMADFLRGEEKEMHDKLYYEKLEIITALRKLREAEEAAQ